MLNFTAKTLKNKKTNACNFIYKVGLLQNYKICLFMTSSKIKIKTSANPPKKFGNYFYPNNLSLNHLPLLQAFYQIVH